MKKLWRELKFILLSRVPMLKGGNELWDCGCFPVREEGGFSLFITVRHILLNTQFHFNVAGLLKGEITCSSVIQKQPFADVLKNVFLKILQ